MKLPPSIDLFPSSRHYNLSFRKSVDASKNLRLHGIDAIFEYLFMKLFYSLAMSRHTYTAKETGDFLDSTDRDIIKGDTCTA